MGEADEEVKDRMMLKLVNKRSSRPLVAAATGLLLANVGSWVKLCYVCDEEERVDMKTC